MSLLSLPILPVVRVGFNADSGLFLFAGFIRTRGFARVAHVLRLRTRAPSEAPNGFARLPARLLS